MMVKNSFSFAPHEETGVQEEIRFVLKDFRKGEFALLKVLGPGERLELSRDKLDGHLNYKYKYQTRSEGKWKDISKYQYLPMEAVSEEGLKYIYLHEENSPFLVVVFQAMAKTPGYNYIKTLDEFPVSKLFIKDDYGPKPTGATYYLGESKSMGVAHKVQALIERVRTHNGLVKDRVVCAGSSKGGYASIFHSFLGGYGFAVAGGPQIYLGDYLGKNLKNLESVSTPIYQYITGGLSEEDKSWANGLMTGMIEERLVTSPARPRIMIHVGKGEPHYRAHVKPFSEFMAAMGYEKLDLNLGNYDTHKELAVHFPIFLQQKIRQIMKTGVVIL
ncbi:hypothetical protein KZX50_11830 [Bacillus infantis]|uniref:hypothetical protein n=1 Tax=Bacillus infantis TaxID=324767 RepID=UPI000B9B7242|nr:hypothetical protein [Bacillus infantis]MCK6206134.1 hypothetical protein [Bacillus infantis]OXT16829.1 hypothetical protein B9K06_14175 [Bacillus sp. OG2]